jgi:formylglycine-generating enzyme
MKAVDALGLLLCVLAAPAAAASCDAYDGVPPGFAAARGTEPNRAGMVAIAGGRFRMGSNEGYPEEREVHDVWVRAFRIDRHEVTNAQFERFVEATGYVTRAERAPAAADFRGVAAERLVRGSAVFVAPSQDDRRRGAYSWWKWVAGADWRHPAGPGSDIRGRANHPVVQVAFEDALAYARWLGRDLPTEAQWEYAARGGLDGATYPWGNTPDRPGRPMANTWQGRFPFVDRGTDGHKGTAPVGCYAANGFGLLDVVGNVWEWTRDRYQAHHDPQALENPQVVSIGKTEPAAVARVIKGGSFLCAPDFCVRYRPASRQPQEEQLGAMHVGFRTVLNTPN